MYRINISLEKKYFDRLLKINLSHNYGVLKPGTFCKKIIIDFINENDYENDIQTIDGVKFKQQDLFDNTKKRRIRSPVIIKKSKK